MLLVDDLLATGAARAAISWSRCGGQVVARPLIELAFLGPGLGGHEVHALIAY